METTIIILLVTFLFAVWNALVILWYTTKKQSYSSNWHVVGWIVRAWMAIAVFLQSSWFGLWLYVIVAWHMYDVTINIIRSLPWYHTGQNIFDRFKISWAVKALILLSGLIFLF